MHIFYRISAGDLAAALLAGCAASDRPSTAGERITARGATISEYGDDWSSAQQTVDRGRTRVANSTGDAEQARRRLADARQTIASEEQKLREAETALADGQRMIAEGTANMARAEAEYAAIRRSPPATQ